MGKVTVRHFLNKNLKARIEKGEIYYPLYIQVIVNTKNYKFKSGFSFDDGYITESNLNSVLVCKHIEKESAIIEKTVSYIVENNLKELLNASYIRLCSLNLWNVLNNNFFILFEKECNRINRIIPIILTNCSYYEINEVLNFTRSELEKNFSNDYTYCQTGIDAIIRATSEGELKADISVFDFLHGNAIKEVLKAIELYGTYVGSNFYLESKKIIEELNKLIFINY